MQKKKSRPDILGQPDREIVPNDQPTEGKGFWEILEDMQKETQKPKPAYDVMLIMREIQPFDTLDFCDVLGITKEQFLKRIADIKNRRLNPGYSSYVPQVFMNQLSAQEYGVLQEKLYKFPGFYIQNRTIRQYEYPNAALVLGNIGEVNRKDIENDSYYTQGDYSGRTGIEQSYEEYLRGVKGVEILLRDAHGRIKGRYEEGLHDIQPESGKNLKLSLDMDLQAYGEKLMQNKLGGIVMIEPACVCGHWKKESLITPTGFNRLPMAPPRSTTLSWNTMVTVA